MSSRMRAAFVVLTRLPLGSPRLTQEDFQRTAAFFPWVGVVVGVVAAFALAIGSSVNELVGGVLAVAAGLLVTGAMHEDGLADCADAFLGTSDAARSREILKDPRLGTFGGAALFVVLALRVTLLPTFVEQAMANLVLAATLGRAAMLVVLARATYAGDPLTQKTGPVAPPNVEDALVAAGAPLVVAALAVIDGRVTPIGVAVSALAAGGVGLGAASYTKRRLGGWVGDVLGAAEQVAECAVLFCLAALAPT